MKNVSQPIIVFKDSSAIVLDKPAGMPTVSLKKEDVNTLAHWIIQKFPKQATIGKKSLEGGLVHRLDNDTSGLVVAARTNEAYKILREQFSNGHFEDKLILKEYEALVLGDPTIEEGEINTPIAHHPRKKKKMVVCESKMEANKLKARPAHTKFRVIKKFRVVSKKGVVPYALLQVQTTTGVRHQIRVHLASIGYPLAGDRLYQNAKRKEKDIIGLKGHFLHASAIGLFHPETKKWMRFVSRMKFCVSGLRSIVCSPINH